MKHYLKKLEETVKSNWNIDGFCNYNGEQFTYGEIATHIAKLHIFFAQAGLSKGDRVAICAKNSARWAISFFAVNTYETVVVPILADFMPSSVEHLCGHCGASALFTDADMFKKMDIAGIPGIRFVINVADFTLLYSADESVARSFEGLKDAFDAKYPMGFSRENVCYPDGNDSDLAIINYTSGTTSAPKGVMLRYECMSQTVEFSQSIVPAEPGEKLVSMLPLAHMYGLAIEMIYPACSGCTIFFLGKTPSPTLLLKAMKDIRPYMTVTVPLVMEKVYKSFIKPVISKWYMKILLRTPVVGRILYHRIGRTLHESFGGNSRIYIMGGAPLNPEVEKCFKRIGIPYAVGYGMTEGSPLLAFSIWNDYVPGSCGKPCQELRIDSEDPQHIAGEIQVRGKNICSGYYNNPEANAMAFTEDGFLRTGDLGILDSHNNLFIRGRSKSMILTANGQNIYPEEVEAVINAQDYVSESVVVDRSSRIVALIYLDKDSIRRDKLDNEAISDIPETVRINANRQLPGYSQIAKVEVVTVPFEKTPKMSIKRFLYK